MSFLILVLVVGLIVAGRAVVVLATLLAMSPPVVPCPTIAVLPVHITLVVAESPCVLLLEPVALAVLTMIVPAAYVSSQRGSSC